VSAEGHNNFTISPDNKKISVEEESISKIYQWACRLTAEQSEEQYFWTEETNALLHRLQVSKGNMIAVLGLQGSGKTALRQALYLKLLDAEKKAYSVKWVGRPELTIIQRIREAESGFLGEADAEYFDTLFDDVYQKYVDAGEDIHAAFKIVKHLRIQDLGEKIPYQIADFIKAKYGLRTGRTTGDEDIARIDLWRLLPFLEKASGSKKLKEIRDYLLTDKLQTADVILIDLPDYDRSNIRQMSKDLTAIQEYWENILTDQYEGYKQDVSLMIFFQKELFQGHFFMGKLDVYELKPLTPNELLLCYRSNFGSYEPFTEEALKEIAFLSRGIFRRFKKYVRICLDRYIQKAPDTITPEHITEWITLDQLIKDMELELMTMFPKEKEHRVLSVKTLQLLREKGSLPQSEIIQEIFDGATVKASRVLNRLESWNYLKRERQAKEKIVSLA